MAAHFRHHSSSTLADAAGPAIGMSAVKSEDSKASAGGLSLQNFNILQVLEQGTILVASEGQVAFATPHVMSHAVNCLHSLILCLFVHMTYALKLLHMVGI